MIASVGSPRRRETRIRPAANGSAASSAVTDAAWAMTLDSSQPLCLVK